MYLKWQNITYIIFIIFYVVYQAGQVKD